MSFFLRIIALFVAVAVSSFGAAPTTGQILFQQKSSGAFDQFGVTPVTNQVFGWDGTKVVMLGTGGGISWGSITGTLSSQTDLQTALNAKLSLSGTLALGGFGSITGTLPAGNLPATAQLTNGTLALGGFGSITGTLADARLSGNVQLKNGTLAIAGFGSVTGTLPTANLPTIPDGNLSANVQLKDGPLALAGFGSITGTLPAGNVGDLSATYLTLSAATAAYQPLDGDLTAIAALSGTHNIYYRSAANTWSSLNIGTGLDFTGGTLSATNAATVTSVALSLPGIFSVSGSPVTTSGTLTASLANQNANLVWAGPGVGSPGAPTFRSLVAADLPDLSSTYLTTTAATAGYQPLSANLTAFAATSGTNTIYYRSASNTWTAVTMGTGLTFSGGTLSSTATSGTVTSVAVALPDIFSLSGSPVTTSGTITGTLANQAIKTVFAGPASGSSGTPAFRLLAAGDIPDISATYLTTMAATAGYQPLDGDLTALAALSGTNNIYYRSAANTWSSVAVGTGLSFSGGTLTATTTGTVSSVALTLPDVFSVSGSPVTTTGTLAATLANQSANRVWAGPTTGSATTPAFRSLVAADIPDLSGTYLTPAAGNAAYQPLNANLTSIAAASSGSDSLYYRLSGGTWAPVTIGSHLSLSGGTLSSTGSVTSVAFAAPAIFSVSGSPITSSGTITMGLATELQKTFFAGPTSGSAATPTFRVLAATDIPDLSATYQPVDADLTAIAALTGTNTIYYRSAANTWTAVTIGAGLGFSGGSLTSTTFTNQSANIVLAGPSTGSAAAPTFRALVSDDLPSITAAKITGTIAADNAPAGNLGEYVETIVGAGSAVGLTTLTTADITSISLTAGDWDVEGSINFVLTGATVTSQVGGISTTTTTVPTDGTEVFSGIQTAAATTTDGVTLPRKRINVTTTTTVYLCGQSTFSVGSVAAYGTINARRVR